LDRSELTKIIKSKALEFGFQKVGIAPAGPTAEAELRLNEWLSGGYHGTMHWIEKRKEERGNILSYFPEARSVISVGMNYYTGNSENIVSNGSKEFHFSNYSWGDDYHEIIKDRLKMLAQTIKTEIPGIKGIYCVDTSPVMEKLWAQKAGLGWQGKHTTLISRDYGSWLFLGELILDYELDYDLPFSEDLCGSCTACIDACPTNALDAYVLDAKKCISYLTIEYRGELEGREKLNNWVFGCDICQEVCPWNQKFQQNSAEKYFKPRDQIKSWNFADWIENIPDNFSKIFKKSPIKRTKATGLLRNFKAVNKDIN